MYAHELYEQNKPRVVVTYPGRFQPFHQGHAGVFAKLQKQFGRDSVYILTSNDTSSAKSPFNFSDKYQLMTAAGVPGDKIIETNQMYKLPDSIDAANTIFITAVGAPDADRLNPDTYTKRDQKDKEGNVTKPAGSPSYYKIWGSAETPVTADQHGYVIVIPEIHKEVTIKGQKYDVSHGTECRNLWNSIRNDAKARTEFLSQMYARPSQELAAIFDKIPQATAEDISADNQTSTSLIHGTEFKQGVAEDNSNGPQTVTRIDSQQIKDFGSNLKNYKHTDDWSQSGIDTGDDSYWQKKNLKTNDTKGLFAGDPHRTALYATGNAHETRYVEFTQNGQPIVYFDKKDLPKMRGRKTYLTVFDAANFKELPTGEYFSENPGKPLKQTVINDPFQYIADQGWIVRVTDDLNKVFKQVQSMHKNGKIQQYGAEGMDESVQQGVSESQTAKTGIMQTDVYGSRAYHARCLEPGCDWESRRYDRIQQAQAAAKKHSATHFDKKDLAENFADGITFSHSVSYDHEDNPIALNIIAHSNGQKVGYIEFATDDPQSGIWWSEHTAVNPQYQRQGIARSMYDYAKGLKNIVKQIFPSPNQSPGGKAIWKDKKVWENFADGRKPGVAEGGVAKAPIKVPTEDGIGWQDIRLLAGEGKLTQKTIKQAIDIIRKQRKEKSSVAEDAAGVGVVAKNKKMARDPRYSMSITKDVKPSTPKNMLRAFRLSEQEIEEGIHPYGTDIWGRPEMPDDIKPASYVFPGIISAYKAAQKQGMKVVKSAGGRFKLAPLNDPNPELVPNPKFPEVKQKVQQELDKLQSIYDSVGKTMSREDFFNQYAGGFGQLRKQMSHWNKVLSDTPTFVEKSSAIKEDENNPTEKQIMSMVKNFLPLVMKELKIKKLPKIIIKKHIETTDGQATFGRFVNEEEKIYLGIADRHPVDILRTLAHELVHFKQYEQGRMEPDSGDTGSPIENEANAVAGVLMRYFNKKYPDAVKSSAVSLDESLFERYQQFKENGDEPDEVRKQKNLIPFPKGTVKVDVSDVYDWYKLGQEISDLDDANPADFGKGPPQTVMAFGSEPEEHRYLKDLKRLGLKTHDIDENFADGRNPQDKGDSKRYNVPTKGKISTLRKIAKQGGRRGQLAHWMANMRSGKNKK